MSKSIERECPACHKVKVFRSDCKTCGCLKSSISAPVDTDVEAYLRANNSQLKAELLALHKESGSMKELMASVLTSVKALEPLKPAPYKGESKHENDMA